jgi:transposase
MHDTDTRSKFVELRAKGWSLARISADLNVSQRTLVDWQRQEKSNIDLLRAIEFEALREKVQATHNHQLLRLKEELNRIEQELAKRTIEYVSTENLYRLASMYRSEIRKVCQEVPTPDEAYVSERAPAAPSP